MSTVLAFPPKIERALAARTTLEPPERDAFVAALRECGRQDAPFIVERLHALMAVEAHFQTLILYDPIEFLRRPPPASRADREFVLGVQRIFVEAANGLQRFLRRRADWASSDDEGRELVLRTSGLALHAIHGFMKWGYFIDEPVRPAPWRQVHSIYLLAEQEGLAQIPLLLHPAQPSHKPTLQSLYLRPLVLELLNTGNLSPIQVEIVDGWLASWCADYRLDAAYDPRAHRSFVDPASSEGMQLVRPDARPDGARYLRMEALRAQTDEVRAGLRHGRLYAGQGAGSVFPVEQHIALLAAIEKLQHALLPGSAQHIDERRHFEDREVDLALGTGTVLQMVAAAPIEPGPPAPAHPVSAESIEITPAGLSRREVLPAEGQVGAAVEEGVERWRVHDLSRHGFGLVADRQAAERVPLNGLVALRNQETGAWMVATAVRKLPNRTHGETLVGLEVLCHRPIAVELKAPEPAACIPALYLPGRDANGKLDAIILRIDDFDTARAFVLRAGEAEYRIRMNRIIRKGTDWIKARFEISSKKG